jgi:hypothetical protein
MSDREIITILMLYHFGDFKKFKHFNLFCIGKYLHQEFPRQSFVLKGETASPASLTGLQACLLE